MSRKIKITETLNWNNIFWNSKLETLTPLQLFIETRSEVQAEYVSGS